jgi:carbonic anhydrase
MRVLITTIVGLSIAGCGGKPVTTDKAAQSPAPINTNLNSEPGDLKVTLKPIPEAKPAEAAPTAPLAPAPASVKAHRSPVSSEKALSWLKNGNTRFTKHFLRSDGDSAKDRARLLTEGQNPHSIILSCSDSSLPPEVVFDQKLGEVFVIRTAGESLDSAAIASIEYALKYLGSNLILVLGHESCGTIKSALATLGGADAGSPWLNKLFADLHPHLKSFAGKPVSEGTLIEGWANTEGVAKDLVTRSQIVRDALNTGEVKIQTALYHLGSGVVEFK